MSDPKRARLVPHLLVLLPIVLLLGAAVWLQTTDGLGDQGMNNPFTYIALLLAGGLYGLWFLLFSGQKSSAKLGAVLGVAALLGSAVLAIRIDGYSGSMVPQWRWAWEAREAADLTADTLVAGEEAGVDLKTTTPQDFPGFLGPQRNGEVEGVQLAPGWETQAPELLWKQPIGGGWSGFAVVNGVAVTHEQRGEGQFVVARELLTGAELWRFGTDATFDHPLGGPGPRSTPLIHGGLVYAQDSAGRLVCLEGSTGELVWEHDLLEEYGMSAELEEEKIQFGRSCSPLAVDDLLILPVGGNPEVKQAGLVAFDLLTGEVRWEGPPRHVSHASPLLATVAGVRQVLVMNEESVSGHDPATGALLWEHPWPGKTGGDANNTSPTPVGTDGVLISKGYGQGSSLLGIQTAESGEQSVEPRWASRRALRTKLTNPVVRGGFAYALSDGILECTDLQTGKRVWRDGRYGHGQVLLVGEHLLVLSEEGELLLIAADPERENEVLGQIEAVEGVTWNTFALYGDIVVLRNGSEAGAWRLPTVPGE